MQVTRASQYDAYIKPLNSSELMRHKQYMEWLQYKNVCLLGGVNATPFNVWVQQKSYFGSVSK